MTRSGEVEENLLIFSYDTLVAVVRRCEECVNGAPQGFWILETGYGPCATPGTGLTIQSPDEAQQWVLDCVSRACSP